MTAKEEQVAHHLTSSQYSDDNWSINTLDLVSDVGGEKSKEKSLARVLCRLVQYD